MICRYSGKIISTPTIAMLAIVPKAVDNAKILLLKTLNSTNGSLRCNCRYPKMTMKMSPTAMEPRTIGSPQPSLPTSEKPYNKAPNPIDDSISDGTSSFGFESGNTFLKKNMAARITNAAIGRIMPNKTRQPKLSMT